MKVAILSRKPSLFATERLRAGGSARGHEVQVIDYLRCYMNISAVRPTILYRGETLPKFDTVIPRIGASHTVYGTAVVRQFEILGVATANGSDAISRAHDKLRSLQLLAAQGIGLPSTGFAHSSRDLAGLLAGIGDAPVVVKLLGGMPGTGAILAETNAAAASVIEAFSGLDAESLVQEFIAEAAGTSLRCLVVGKRVVAAMRRSARPGEFRSNLHRGGDAMRVRLSRGERRAAVHAAARAGTGRGRRRPVGVASGSVGDRGQRQPRAGTDRARDRRRRGRQDLRISGAASGRARKEDDAARARGGWSAGPGDRAGNGGRGSGALLPRWSEQRPPRALDDAGGIDRCGLLRELSMQVDHHLMCQHQ